MNRPIAHPSAQVKQAERQGPSRWVSALISLVILGGGIGAAVLMVKTKAKPTKSDETVVAPLVEVISASVGNTPVSVELNGEVMPARRVVVMPEVGGRVMWQSPELVPGGILKKGTPLVRLDGRDYALAVKQQQAQLASQKLNLRVEKGRKTVAQREWELFNQERREAGLPALEDENPEKAGTDAKDGDDAKDDAGRLALRDPQVQSAKVAVKSAESSLARSRLALGKTTLSAPFNAFVQAENVDEGQLVSPGYQLATLVGTDAFWVQVSVPVDKLSFIQLPRGKEPGSKATIFMDTGSGAVSREGRVIRLLGDLDPIGRLARVLIEVTDPFMLGDAPIATGAKEGDEPQARIPLLLGSYVRVRLEGVELQGVAEIPRLALQDGERLYILKPDNRLEIRKVTVVWSDRDRVVINGNMKNGERLIVTNLSVPVEGMTLRVADEAAPAASPSTAAASSNIPAKAP
jgi:multidrug efflux pump subunit AcrA (membrane-fusion protein)